MQHIKNFSRYQPQDDNKKELTKNINALFLISEGGQDWYDCQKAFQTDTVKLMIDDNHIIRAITQDVSALCPLNMSVVEIDSIPPGCDINGHWQVIDGEIVKRELTPQEKITQTKRQRNQQLEIANQTIAPLQDAVDLKLATPQEQHRLLAWKRYRIELMRLDITQSDIVWPTVPQEEKIQKPKPIRWFGLFARQH